jgi:hypothetical protein
LGFITIPYLRNTSPTLRKKEPVTPTKKANQFLFSSFMDINNSPLTTRIVPNNSFVVIISFIKSTAIIEVNKGDIETNGADSVAVNLFRVKKVRNLPSPVVKNPAMKKIVNELRFSEMLVAKV